MKRDFRKKFAEKTDRGRSSKWDKPLQPVLEDITVIIPTLGRSVLEECLQHILAGDAWPGLLVVVDQGLSAQVKAWTEELSSLGMKSLYLPSTERGRASGINRGLERVTTPFVAITDDDCFVDRSWLKSMVVHLRAVPEAVVTGRVESMGDGVLGVTVTSTEPAIYHSPRLTFDVMSGGNMGTSMRVFERVGMFDEDIRLRTAEDGEWAYRVLRDKIPIIYVPEVLVRHLGWRDAAERATQYRGYALSHGGFYGKYLRKGDCFIALRILTHHLRALRRVTIGLLEGDREQLLIGRSYLTGLLPGIISGLRRPPG